ncbi:kinase-like domain-containing protein [Polychytrium aggregatum]|uniref:kinase-like domain-containing protein n=1 Tax=Polychytrium aggregatum TaxID=110093 RepID=UPI0022FE9C64|nr:kinase-like domain-containing protein [Polychytrium aggregatum]KAI9190669.1 kinase-like domain-containing protein [Polychytrium aggregatum]
MSWTSEPSDWSIPSDAIKDRSIKPFASGGFGNVYRATYHGAPVAVKYLNGSHQQRFAEMEYEIGIWHKLSHPNVLQFLGAHLDMHRMLMVSPCMKNGHIWDYVCHHSPCPLVQKLRFMFQVACGMSYLHRRNVIHGDLQPTNILINDSPCAVVADFGLARVKVSTAVSVRQYEGFTGTYDYAAPEILRDVDPVETSKEGDVFAFAITTYEVLVEDNAWLDYLCSIKRSHAFKESGRGARLPKYEAFDKDSMVSSTFPIWNGAKSSKSSTPKHQGICNAVKTSVDSF